MANGTRWHQWGPHEGDFLGWLRLRFVLAKVLGRKELADTTAARLDDGVGKPPSLSLCGRTCYRRVLRRMHERGLATPDRAWNPESKPGASWTSVQAAWLLLPAFRERWEPLWRLWLLDQAFGPGTFSRLTVAHSFLQHDRTVLRSPLHAGKRQPPTRLDADIDDMAAEWFADKPDGWVLGERAKDAVTLFRFVLHPSITLPADRLRTIGPIQRTSDMPSDRTSPPSE